MALHRTRTYLFYVLLVTLPELAVEGKTELWMKSFECYDHPYVVTKLKECYMQTSRKGPSLLTVLVEVETSIPHVLIDLVVYSQYQHTRSYLFGTTIDYCDFMVNTGSRTNPVARLAYELAEKNFPQALLDCPVCGVVNITKLPADMNLVPAVMPFGRFHINIRMYNKRNQTMLGIRADCVISQGSILNKTLTLFG